MQAARPAPPSRPIDANRIRRRRALSALVVATGLAALAVHAVAAPVRTDHVEAELVSAQSAIAPGQPATLALRLKIQDGWHTYWRNPGDSGLPTTLEWKLPAGFTAGEIEWPAPRALPRGAAGQLRLRRRGAAPRAADRPGRREGGRTGHPRGARRLARLPRDVHPGRRRPRPSRCPSPRPRSPTAAGSRASRRPRLRCRARSTAGPSSAEGKGANIALTLRPTGAGGHPGELRFFPNDEGRVEPSAPQAVARTPDGAWQVTLPVASQLTPFDRVAGVVTSSRGLATPAGLVHAAALDVPLTGSVVAGPKPKLDAPALSLAPEGVGGAPVGPSGVVSLATAALLAFVGGLLLNLMPCVFPVLGIKVLGFVEHAHGDRRALRRAGLRVRGRRRALVPRAGGRDARAARRRASSSAGASSCSRRPS